MGLEPEHPAWLHDIPFFRIAMGRAVRDVVAGQTHDDHGVARAHHLPPMNLRPTKLTATLLKTFNGITKDFA